MVLPKIDRRFGWLAVATAVAFYVVIVAGGIVRVSGSGLGCPDWPQCYGQWVPPLEVAAWIEFTHRVSASVGSLLLAGMVLQVWRAYRGVPRLLMPTVGAVALLVVQIGLGAVTVLLELPPVIVAAHLGVALLLTALVLAVAVTVFTSHLPAPSPLDETRRRLVARHTLRLHWAAAATFGLLLTGAIVAGASATWACPGIPWCDQQMANLNPLAWLQMFHRTVAVAVTVWLGWLAWRGWDLRRELPGVGVAGWLSFVLAVTQVGVGVTGVWLNFGPWLQGLHLAVASLFWAAVAVQLALACLGGERQALAGEAAGAVARSPGTPRSGQPAGL